MEANWTLHTEDRINAMVKRLEIITNSSAEEYMTGLNVYMQKLSIIRTWPRPPDDLPLDKSVGLVWVALIPILYFIMVALTMGVLVAYTWYSHTLNPDNDQPSDLASSTGSNRLNNNTFVNSDRNRQSNTFVRSSAGTGKVIDSIIRASITSKGSTRSIKISNNDTEYLTDGGSTSVRSHFSGVKKHSEQTSKESKASVHHPINISIAGRSCYSDDSYENEDRLSRDSLRTSMESQKLLAAGVVEIAPDDLYSLSDNTAYNDCNKTREICASGVENPSFEIDNGVHFLEDPMGHVIDHKYDDVKQHRRPFPFHCANNASSIFTTTNYATSSVSGQQLSESSSSVSEPKFAMNFHNLNPIFNGENIRSGQDTNLSKNKYEKNVGGSLPPLPPSHYHRNEAGLGGAPSVSRIDFYRRGELGGSIFDTSSLVDTSADSATLSLPSSIVRFHASRVQPRPTPRDGYPLASTQNYTSSMDADWSPCHRLDTSGGQGTDSFSICPNRGSFSQSFEGSNSNTAEQNQCHGQSLMESFDSSIDEHQDQTTNLKYSNTCNNNVVIDEPDTFDQKLRAAVKETKDCKEIIRCERDPRMKRMMSLNLLKSGKVSVNQRLREFGYTRPEGKKVGTD